MIAIPNDYNNKTSNIESTPNISNPDSKERTIKRFSEELAKSLLQLKGNW